MTIIRSVAIWTTGIIAAVAIGGVVGNALVYDGGSWVAVGGACAFICARLWAGERTYP